MGRAWGGRRGELRRPEERRPLGLAGASREPEWEAGAPGAEVSGRVSHVPTLPASQACDSPTFRHAAVLSEPPFPPAAEVPHAQLSPIPRAAAGDHGGLGVPDGAGGLGSEQGRWVGASGGERAWRSSRLTWPCPSRTSWLTWRTARGCPWLGSRSAGHGRFWTH